MDVGGSSQQVTSREPTANSNAARFKCSSSSNVILLAIAAWQLLDSVRSLPSHAHSVTLCRVSVCCSVAYSTTTQSTTPVVRGIFLVSQLISTPSSISAARVE